jgi:ammonium transporter, Amt family
MRKRLICRLSLVFIFLSLAQPLLPQTATEPATSVAAPATSSDTNTRLAKLEQQVADAKSSADNAWMLTSSALVLMMTGPGLALFYGGLVRKKNVLGTMMQSFALMAVITVLWGLFSFSLAFAPGNSFIGGLHHLFLRGVGAAPDADYAGTIPLQTFMVYQLMFVR